MGQSFRFGVGTKEGWGEMRGCDKRFSKASMGSRLQISDGRVFLFSLRTFNSG